MQNPFPPTPPICDPDMVLIIAEARAIGLHIAQLARELHQIGVEEKSAVDIAISAFDFTMCASVDINTLREDL